MNVVERYVLFWAMLFFVFVFIAAFKTQELSVNIQIPSLPENIQKLAWIPAWQ